MQACSAPPACRCLSENQGVLSPSEATLATAHSRRKCHPEPKARDLLRGFAGVASSPHDPRRRFLPSKTQVELHCREVDVIPFKSPKNRNQTRYIYRNREANCLLA